MAWKLLVHIKEMFFRQICVPGAQLWCSIPVPVEQGVMLITTALFWPYFLSVFNWSDQIQLSFEPITCYRHHKLHRSISHSEKGGERGKEARMTRMTRLTSSCRWPISISQGAPRKISTGASQPLRNLGM